MKYGQQLVYAYNHHMPDCSEFGSIGFKLTAASGLKKNMINQYLDKRFDFLRIYFSKTLRF